MPLLLARRLDGSFVARTHLPHGPVGPVDEDASLAVAGEQGPGLGHGLAARHVVRRRVAVAVAAYLPTAGAQRYNVVDEVFGQVERLSTRQRPGSR